MSSLIYSKLYSIYLGIVNLFLASIRFYFIYVLIWSKQSCLDSDKDEFVIKKESSDILNEDDSPTP